MPSPTLLRVRSTNNRLVALNNLGLLRQPFCQASPDCQFFVDDILTVNEEG